MINISEITIKKLKAGDLAIQLPEVYELKDVIENNRAHINQSVFDHTLAVVNNLKKIVEDGQQNNYLEKLIGENSKKQLLIFATFFHDIGKKETLVEKDGKNKCLGHEAVSAKKVPDILERFNLLPTEKDYIIRIIFNHGVLHDFMDKVDRTNLELEYNNAIKEIKDIIYEILILTEADMMAGDLKKNSPDEYNFRMNFYNKVIKELKK
jgi:putative nucleotidyltransferase with HDIG domain